jgi:hypothetical protein
MTVMAVVAPDLPQPNIQLPPTPTTGRFLTGSGPFCEGAENIPHPLGDIRTSLRRQNISKNWKTVVGCVRLRISHRDLRVARRQTMYSSRKPKLNHKLRTWTQILKEL